MGNSETNSSGAGPDLSILGQDSNSPRILVADDDPDIRKLIAAGLVRANYRVDTARDGAEAWKALNDCVYSLLVTDQKMPKVTGIELIRKLRSANMNLPVILVSGTLPPEELTRHPDLRIDATIPKPFNIPELLNAVRKALGHPTLPTIADSSNESETPPQNGWGAPVRVPGVVSASEQSGPGPRILVVDDDSESRNQSIDVLSAANYEVEGVKDGAAGWGALQANYNYDLIITDNHMPKMTGIELIEKLRSNGLTHPVIMATGASPDHEFSRRPWLKPDVMLLRPFTSNDLLDAVKQVLRTGEGKNSRVEYD